jgi:xanthine dehydrogenase iron-sulfur cluster and FAD-binding subunit A
VRLLHAGPAGRCRKALLDRNPDPTETEALLAAGSLCQCTGYDKVIRAVLDAAAGRRAHNAPSDMTMYLGRFESN